MPEDFLQTESASHAPPTDPFAVEPEGLVGFAPLGVYSVTTTLIVINVIVFLCVFIQTPPGTEPSYLKFGADWGPATLAGQWWRPITSQFLQVTFSHLLENMITLWLLGKRVEKQLGHFRFAAFYLLCGVAGSLLTLALNPYPYCFGASGSIAGLTAAILVSYAPRYRELSWFGRAKLLGVFLLAVSVFIPSSFASGINDLTHIGGFMMGLSLAVLLEVPPGNYRRWPEELFAGAGIVLLASAIVLHHNRMNAFTFARALHAAQDHHPQLAQQEILKALAADPQSWYLRNWSIQLFFSTSDLRDAETQIQLALASDPANDAALSQQAHFDVLTHHCEAAGEIMSRLLNKKSEYGRATAVDYLQTCAPQVVPAKAIPAS